VIKIPGKCGCCHQWKPLLFWAKSPDPRPLAGVDDVFDADGLLNFIQTQACVACGPLWALSNYELETIRRRPRRIAL